MDAARDGDLRGRNIADGHGHKARTDAAACIKRLLGVRHRGHARHSRAHHNANPVGLGFDGKTTALQCLLRRSIGKLHERVHGARKRLGHVIGRIEILQLSCNLYGQIRRIKARDRANTATAFDQRIPIGGYSYADRRDRPHAGDYQCFFFHASSPFLISPEICSSPRRP